jgi:hypothetical protein
MKKLVVGWLVALVVSTSIVTAQESQESEPRQKPTRRIRVLEDPYQLASFYRSDASGPAHFGEQPLTDRGSMADRYPIAGFYRQGGGQGRYSGYWTSPSAGAGWARRGYGRTSRRRVGASDLCLIAPTLLAPVGPLTGSGR